MHTSLDWYHLTSTISTGLVLSFAAGGIDTRIRGIKLVSTEERSLGFDRDFFTTKNLVRFPVLESFSPDALYRRAIALQR